MATNTNKWNLKFVEDLGERVAATFVAAYAPLVILAHFHFHTHQLEVAGIAAALTLAKGLGVNLRNTGPQPTASLAHVSSTKVR